MVNTAIDHDEWNPEWDELRDYDGSDDDEFAADMILERQEFEDFEQPDEYCGVFEIAENDGW